MTIPAPSNEQLATTLLEIVRDNHASLLSDEREAMRLAAQRLQEISNSPLTANPAPLTAKEAEDALRPKPTTEADSYKFPVGTVFVVDRKKFGGEPIGSTKDYMDAVRNAKASSATGCPAYVLACLHKVTCVPNPTYKVEAP